jgi:cellulose synthase/poly-beta-1,6-N-acetylglucosamine synthase-like glycosyltransferase
MAKQGLPIPDIWETPHYALSALDDKVLNTLYPLRYESLYSLGSLPFPVKTNGALYIPENMGFVLPGGDYAEGRSLDDMKMLIERIAVFEDPVASFFWHPWRELPELKSIVGWLHDAGFEFVSAYDLFEIKKQGDISASTGINQWRSAYSPSIGYAITNTLIAIAFIVFFIGSFVYILNLLRMKRNLKRIGRFNMSLIELRDIAREHKSELPKVAIFVPARNEGAVIENTIRQLAALDYPKHLYRAVIIVDEREREDNLERRTIDVVRRVAQEINHKFNTEFVHCIEVPKWYSGTLGSLEQSYEKSTKGRALNYMLQSLYDQPKWRDYEMIGILDADGRLHPNVLKEVAYKRITKKSKLLQGPVFQVSNFGHVSLVGMCAALELAVHHTTTLPRRLLRGGKLQFVAGTNYFIDKDLIADVGGWDCDALVEDAELALRLYVRQRTTAEWLDAPEIEQTPPSFSIYRRQRERWVRGHFMLLHDIKRADIPFLEKVYLYNKIVISQFRFIPEFTLAILSIVYMFMGYLMDLGQVFNIISVYLLCTAILMFNLYALTYWALRKYIPTQTSTMTSITQYLKLFLFFPVFMVCQCVPRVEGLFNFARRHHVAWYKTERTQEGSGEVLFLGDKELVKDKVY